MTASDRVSAVSGRRVVRRSATSLRLRHEGFEDRQRFRTHMVFDAFRIATCDVGRHTQRDEEGFHRLVARAAYFKCL